VVERRWDIDERGRGIAAGLRLAPGARELVDALELPDWVAEEPDAHLLPHLERACASDGSPLELETTDSLPDGTYEVRLRWHGGDNVGATRAAVFCLIGVVAESATYVRQRGGEGELIFEVGTGMLEADTDFAPHGHTLLLRVRKARSQDPGR
jgi:hypothetical protein